MEPKRLDHDDDISCKISKIKLSGGGGVKLTELDDKSTPSTSDFVGGKTDAAAEAKLDLEVEREWKQIQNEAGSGKIEVANNPRARKIAKGLVINHMNMRCGDTGKLMWQSDEWGDDVYTAEQEARIPASILKCSAVSREINFSSAEEITQFRLEQRVFLAGSCIEEWLFEFGYVIPGSTNTWQQTIESAGAENMLDPESISGKLTIETAFYEGQSAIAKTVYRIFYV
ncbi:hypothetical protein PybrP1_011530 [[Pythium] brassicae (nom. inval.)]|nr:hypothetical protein PybrP1_011530 [[Pythium] brassicae (nom. inval.)]